MTEKKIKLSFQYLYYIVFLLLNLHLTCITQSVFSKTTFRVHTSTVQLEKSRVYYVRLNSFKRCYG